MNLYRPSIQKIFFQSLAQGLGVGMIFVLVGLAVLFGVEDRYRASADFLVSSNQGGQDYYTATRSAEYMSRVLAEVVYSERFINAVGENEKVGSDFLPREKKDRLEAWSKMLHVQKNNELGFVRLVIGGDNERSTMRVSQAVVEVLNTNASVVFGEEASRISIRLLSGPILERNPSASQIVTLFFGGLLLGVFLVFVSRLLRTEFVAPR